MLWPPLAQCSLSENNACSAKLALIGCDTGEIGEHRYANADVIPRAAGGLVQARSPAAFVVCVMPKAAGSATICARTPSTSAEANRTPSAVNSLINSVL